MPCAGLEATLAEDAVSAGLALDAGEGGWRPDPKVWAAPIARALPDLEATLRRWPSASGLWKTWLSWAPLHPLRPSPYAFAQTVVVASPRSRWVCRLPEELHRAIQAELQASHRFLENLSWFQEAWEGLKLAVEDRDRVITPAQIEMLYMNYVEAKVAAGDRLESTDLGRERIALLAELSGAAPLPAPPKPPSALEGLTGFPAPVRKGPAGPWPTGKMESKGP